MGLFWKSSNTRFQPYLVNMDLGLYIKYILIELEIRSLFTDICDAPQQLNSSHPLINLIVRCVSKVFNPSLLENLRNGCPLMVLSTVNYTDVFR